MLNNKKGVRRAGPHTTYYYTITDFIFCKDLFYNYLKNCKRKCIINL